MRAAMDVQVSRKHPAKLAGDVVVQVVQPPFRGGLPLASHLAKNASRLVTRAAEAMTWLEPRRMRAPRVLVASFGAKKEHALAHGFGGSVDEAEQRAAIRHALRSLGAEIERACHEHDIRRVILAPMPEGLEASMIVEGMMLRAYGSTEFRADDVTSTVERVTVCDEHGILEDELRQVRIIADATNYARELADLPSNVGTPAGIVARVRKTAPEAGLRLTILDEKKIRSLKMGLFLGVSAGAGAPGRILIMEHGKGRGARVPTLVLVGKGLTHDTGGYNLKTIEGLHDLTYDKCGAMAVIGAMHAIARLDLPLRVVGVTPLAENCVDANAFKPGDILTAMDGTTVYVDNTDAEGRLVLADCLSYVKRYDPDVVIDVATLTGAASVALGSPFAGLFATDDRVRDLLVRAGLETDDLVWPMPIHPAHRSAMDHHHAHLRNAGPRTGGACTAAAFLHHFTAYPWAHIDIAGKASSSSEQAYTAAGASGFGTRLLVRAAQAVADGGLA